MAKWVKSEDADVLSDVGSAVILLHLAWPLASRLHKGLYNITLSVVRCFKMRKFSAIARVETLISHHNQLYAKLRELKNHALIIVLFK